MDVDIRPSRPEDAESVVPFIYSSGPYSFDYVFERPNRCATDFLTAAFAKPGGELGYRDHVTVCARGKIVGCGTIMSPQDSVRYAWHGASQILRHYGWITGSGVLRRALAVERVIRPASGDLWIIGHLGVAPEMQGQRIGMRLIEFLMDSIRKQGGKRVGLDVALINPRAEALYERVGFKVTEFRESKLSNEFGAVPNFHRMEMAL